LQLEEAEKLHSHANSSGSGAQEEDTMGCQGLTRGGRREFGGIQKAGQNYSTGALHVIVEDWIAMTEGIQIIKGVLGREVLYMASRRRRIKN
jgi:hypothetical protein